MAEYIDREAVLGMLPTDCVMRDLYAMGYNTCKHTMQTAIKAIPTADVVEVVHGKWVGENNMRLKLPQLAVYDDWYCSQCGNYWPERYIGSLGDYCPNCGAKMDGKGDA